MRTGSDTETYRFSGDAIAAIQARYVRRIEELQERPELAQCHGTARVELAYGFACNVDLGDRSLRVDLPRAEGGTGSGPHPEQLMRASLSACLVMGYRAWAVRFGVPLDDVALEFGSEFDERGQLGIDAAAPVGWRRICWRTTFWSTAPLAELERVLETAHRYSPMLANLASGIERAFALRVMRPASEVAVAETNVIGTDDLEPVPCDGTHRSVTEHALSSEEHERSRERT
jgi:uncharacterized OsmC-like protein